MKVAVQKNHLRGQILYRTLDPSKKRRLTGWSTISDLSNIRCLPDWTRISGAKNESIEIFESQFFKEFKRF